MQGFVENGEFFKCKGKVVLNESYEILSPLNSKIEVCENELGKVYEKEGKFFVEFKKMLSQNNKEYAEIHSGNENAIKMPNLVPEFSFLRKEIV